LLLALLWTGWHLPLFFYPGWTMISLWIYALIVNGVTVLMTYGTNLARFSVITPIAMHAMFGSSAAVLQRVHEVAPGYVNRRYQTEENAGSQRYRCGE
jgi:hypothetical protein